MLWNGVPEQTVPKSDYDDTDDEMGMDAKISMVFQPPLKKYLDKHGGSDRFYAKTMHPYVVALVANGYIEVSNADREARVLTMVPVLKDWSDASIESWAKGVKHIVDEINLYVV